MKTISITILLAIAVFSLNAQNAPIDKLFDKYGYKDGFTTVYISKHMFQLFANKNSGESQDEFIKAISGIESIRILVADSITGTKINFFNEVSKDIPFNLYSPLMVVKEKNQDIRMLIREKDSKIIEFLMLGGGNDNFLISITGNIDLNSISNLSKAMDIDGLDNLDKLDKKDKIDKP